MNTPGALAVHRKPLRDDVFDVLHARILAGAYASGKWLRQEEISSELGVSMTPVREALDLLVSSGLAERVPYRGVRILQPSAPEILDSYGMRLLLESAAAYAAALNATMEQIAHLQELVDGAKSRVRLEDIPRERALSRELHADIVAASGNPLLLKMYLPTLNTFPDWMLYEHLYRQPELLGGSMRCEHEEHRLIVEALASRHAHLAARRTIEHVKNRGRELVAYLGIPAGLVKSKEDQILPLLAVGRPSENMIEKEYS